MHRDEIDAVAVLWQDVPGDYTGRLTFGVGARDENVDQIGLTDLVKQVVLAAASTEADEHSGLLETEIIASGTPADVAAHLTECAALIADLPLDGLAQTAAHADPGSRSVGLDVDIDDASRDPWGSLMARRLGPSGPGLLRWPAVDYPRFTVEEVRAHVAGYFTAGNAVLSLTGPPPAGLRLGLPAGPRATHAASLPVPGSGPAWYADEVVAPGIAVSATAGAEAFLILNLLWTRADALMKDVGLDCWSTEWSTPVGGDHIELGMSIHLNGKAKQRDSAVVARILWQELRRLAAEEPARAEIEEIIKRFTHPPELVPELRQKLERAGQLAAAERAFATAPLDHAAKKALFGTYDEFGDEEIAAAARLSPADVRSAAASWLPSAMVVVPVGTEPDLDGMSRITCPVSHFSPRGEVLKPSMWRKLRGAADRLVLGDDAFHLIGADGAVHTFPIADVMLIQREGETLLGNVRHGCLVDVSGFAGADKLVTRVPPRRHRLARD